uniref:Protein kinase domain-containing protein n=1 Tax=Strongyloides papillosus TaxID=174720 RepID=A0A0N5BPH5_STREA
MLHYTFQRSSKEFLDSLVPPRVHESLSAKSSPDRDPCKEDQVRVFVKQLLTALQYMHDRNQPHLDLRPEVVLLQDDHLCLADFGQNIHVKNGRITGKFKVSPEFVAPEIVKGGKIGLYSDMWSVGIMTFVLLGGVSPFLGDNDNETLLNVAEGRFDLQCKELSYVTNEAIDFLERLLVINPFHRMTVNEALSHPWIAESSLLDARLSSECLREFKYRHKWLERRVFVQQTPSESILKVEPTPVPEFCQSHPSENHLGTIIDPVAIYDFLIIKDQPRLVEPKSTYGSRLSPEVETFSNLSPETSSISFNKLSYPLNYIDDSNFGFYRTESEESINTLPFDENTKFKIGSTPKDLSPPFLGLIGNRGTPQKSPSPSMQNCGEDRKILQPQEGGECPIGDLHKKDIERKLKKAIEDRYLEEEEGLFETDLIPPLHLIKGERREIEEEIANRILSDISEENSFAGSVISLDDIEPTQKLLTNNPKRRSHRSRSRSNTPMENSLSEETYTPIPSPSVTIELEDDFDGAKKFFSEKGYNVPPEQTDPSVPVNAPLFLEGLGHHKITVTSSGERPLSRGGLSPGLRCRPGTKSPVLLSPGKEHKMECVISTKRGKQKMTKPMDEEAPVDHSTDTSNQKQKASVIFHDDDFDALMAEAEKIKTEYKEKRPKLNGEKKENVPLEKVGPINDEKNNIKLPTRRYNFEEELEKYRPKNVYKEEEYKIPEVDIDDYIWDSHYQIGPDTLLLASKGPDFNARVRGYRTALWGEGAPYVGVGILGFRNRDITVRERRRYTDLIKEEPPNKILNAGVTDEFGKKLHMTHYNINKPKPYGNLPYNIREQKGSVIFKQRLRDVYWHEGKSRFLFECQVIGNPTPQITWKYNNNVINESDRCIIKNHSGYCSLEIIKPELHELGEYVCEARNENGFDITNCRAYSGDGPGKPGRPEIELASDTEVLIGWEMPETCTTLEGVKYKLEVRLAGENDHFAQWIGISDNIDGEVCLVKHLSPQGIYQFRVTAKNGFGWGLPSLNSRIIKTHRRGVPKLQAELLKRDICINSVSIPIRPLAKRNSRGGGLCEILEESNEDIIEGSNEGMEINSKMENLDEGVALLVNEDITKRFQIEKEIFRGRFSVVKNASDSKNEGKSYCVAKKRLTSYPDVPTALDEYENLKTCQHENVVQLVGAYENGSTMTLVTERLYEDVFHRFCFIETYNEESVVLTVRQIVSALHWIHYKGILHLDIQPDNVMFVNKRSWFIKIIDFGSSKKMDKDPIKSSTIHQRIDWRAPEVVKGENVTEKTDCFGMGLIAFTILSGFHPFSMIGDTQEEISNAILNVKCDPNLIPVQASQEALKFVTWALKKDPRRRISTSEALTDRWLSSDVSIVRRREAIKYNSSRLRKTADYIMRRVPRLNGFDMTPEELTR